MSQTVVGVFNDLDKAQDAYDHLISNGFSQQQIDLSQDYSVLDAQKTETKDERKDEGIGGFFESLFGSGDEADKYQQATREGCVLTVHADTPEEARQAQLMLDEDGALDLDVDEPTTTTNAVLPDTDSNNDSSSIKVIEEELQVGKREQETGKVSVRSRIVEKPVEEHLRLRSEHITVERNPVNRKATADELKNFVDGEVSMTEHTEEAVVSKEAHVVEEINIRKDVEEREETIRENIKKTEVDVDKTSEEQKSKDLDRF